MDLKFNINKIKEMIKEKQDYEERIEILRNKVFEINENLEEYRKFKTMKLYCCDVLLEGKNIKGYKEDYRCWGYKCPICDKKYYVYDYNTEEGRNE